MFILYILISEQHWPVQAMMECIMTICSTGFSYTNRQRIPYVNAMPWFCFHAANYHSNYYKLKTSTWAHFKEQLRSFKWLQIMWRKNWHPFFSKHFPWSRQYLNINFVLFVADRVLYARKAGEDIAGSSVEAGEKITLETASVSIKRTHFLVDFLWI